MVDLGGHADCFCLARTLRFIHSLRSFTKPIPGTLQVGGAPFETTHWTVVLQGGDAESVETRRKALATFSEAYWPPLYTFVRHSALIAKRFAYGGGLTSRAKRFFRTLAELLRCWTQSSFSGDNFNRDRLRLRRHTHKLYLSAKPV
jgi:hypothetical protein